MYVIIIIMCYYFAWVDISRVIDFTIAICQNLICCNTNRNINKKQFNRTVACYSIILVST